MMKGFGEKRVLEPRDTFPVSAWRLDNDPHIKADEMKISVERIKLEEGNFRQLCNSCDYDSEKIKERILNIIDRRGKLHNHLTDSGGICLGTVTDIGEDYKNTAGFVKGDRVVGIVSLTSIPLCIDKIKSINFNYGQIEVEGYAFLFSASPTIHVPRGIQEEILLSAFDESASIAKASEMVRGEERILILGSNILTVLIYAAATKAATGGKCINVACLEMDEASLLKKTEVESLLESYADKVYLLTSKLPKESYEEIKQGEGSDEESLLFDSSIICSNMGGVEAVGVMLTRDSGHLFFTNLINNYNMAVLLAESMGKNLNTVAMEEYKSDFPEFTVELLCWIGSNLSKVHKIYKKNNIVSRYRSRYMDSFDLRNIKKIDGYAYRSKRTEDMLNEALNIAGYDCNVMLLGETGVGKERILDIIYKNSSRRNHRCVKINCSAISESLAESEFFGYEEGAFTGAKCVGKKGFFEIANNGILFLDEVGDMPMSLQAKLLRVLQESQFYRVGGESPVNVNVRVICATNRNIREMVEAGTFREDLYYRLNICELEILPLRSRAEDVEALAEMFAEKYNGKYMLDRKFTIEAMSMLRSHSWPGNVRELENTIHKLIISSKSKIIDDVAVYKILNDRRNDTKQQEPSLFGEEGDEGTPEICAMDKIMEKHEKAIIKEALQKGRTTREAAAILGISQSQLMRKKKKYGL